MCPLEWTRSHYTQTHTRINIQKQTDGQLTFWNIQDGIQTGSIECRRDIAGGRKLDDKVTAKNRYTRSHFCVF